MKQVALSTLTKIVMSLISILIVLVIVGGISYAVSRATGIGPTWKYLIYAVLFVFVLVWLLRQLQASGVDIKI